MAATAMSQKSFVGAQLQHLPARAQTQDRAVRAAVVRWRGWAVVTLRSDQDPRDRMPRASLRVLSGLQVAALRALVRRYAEEGARGTAVLVVRREGVHADTPVEPIASLRRPGPCIEAHETRRRPLSVAVDTNREECYR